MAIHAKTWSYIKQGLHDLLKHALQVLIYGVVLDKHDLVLIVQLVQRIQEDD